MGRFVRALRHRKSGRWSALYNNNNNNTHARAHRMGLVWLRLVKRVKEASARHAQLRSAGTSGSDACASDL